jgi:hypothetical protein
VTLGAPRDHQIKSCFCPDIGLKIWGDLKHHCDTTGARQLKIPFCHSCGDFFARGDSPERHRKNPALECISATPEKAAAKRRDSTRVRLELDLKKGEDIEMSFSQIIKNPYPESAKKCAGGCQLKGR